MPVHPLGYESKFASLSTGQTYRYVDVQPLQGVKTIATALVLHGFPDSAYGWRNQVKGWSNRGIRLIIPDALGYTGTSQPLDPEEYSFKRQSDHYEALIKYIGLPEGEKIVVISHDWGAVTGMRLSQFKPDLVKGIASLCVPFSFAVPTQEYVSTTKLLETIPSFGYQLFFESPESGPIIDAHLEKFMAAIFASAQQVQAGERPSIEGVGAAEAYLKSDSKPITPGLLTKEEFDTIIAEIKAGAGFSAMCNYYRTRKINYDLDKDLPQEYRPDIPKLLVVPTQDKALPASLSANAEKEFKNIEVMRFDKLGGHWVQLDMPEEVEKAVGEWVERMASKEWTP